MEYLFSGLDLWYSKRDEAAAEKEALEELKQAMINNPSLTFQTAQTLLYQPTASDRLTSEPIVCKAAAFDKTVYFGDVVKVIIVNSSLRLYMKYSKAIFRVLEQSSYQQSEFYHLHSIEDFFLHHMQTCNGGTVGGISQCRSGIAHIIIFDQDEFCSFDVQITTQIVACLRKYYDQASTLIGFYADGESSSTMYMRLLDFDAIDFRYLQPHQDPMTVLSSMVNKPMDRLQTAIQSTPLL